MSQHLTRIDKILVLRANAYLNGIDFHQLNDQEIDKLIQLLNKSRTPLSWKNEDHEFVSKLKNKGAKVIGTFNAD